MKTVQRSLVRWLRLDCSQLQIDLTVLIDENSTLLLINSFKARGWGMSGKCLITRSLRARSSDVISP